MKNNSMAELYHQESATNKIVKPRQVNIRNSANGATCKTAASSSHTKTFDHRTTNRRSDTNEKDSSNSKRLLNREDLLSGSPLNP